MQYFSTLFGKILYMFRADLLSIIRSLNTVFTAIGICHTSYVDCLVARSGENRSNMSETRPSSTVYIRILTSKWSSFDTRS